MMCGIQCQCHKKKKYEGVRNWFNDLTIPENVPIHFDHSNVFKWKLMSIEIVE